MTSMIKTLAFAASAVVAFSAFSVPALAQDSDGCFPAPNCTSSKGIWRGNYYDARVTNRCSGRIYVKLCFKKASGGQSCRESGIPGGRSHTFSGGSDVVSSGDFKYRWLGSSRSSKDWVCTSKVSFWQDRMF